MTHPDINLEQRLVAALHQEASIAMTTTDTPRELERWREEQHRRKTRLRFTLAAAAAAAAVAVVLGLVFGLNGSGTTKREPIHKPPAPSTADTATLTKLDPVPAGTEVLKTAGPVNPGAVAFGAVWASGLEKTADQVYRLDPNTGVVLSKTHVVTDTTVAPVPTRIGDRILVPGKANGRTGYVVLDRSGSVVDVLPAQLVGLLAGDARGGWVQVNTDTIGQVDASGTKILQRVRVANPDSGAVLSALAVSGDSVYAATQFPARVYRLDAASGQVVDTIDVDAAPNALAVSSSAVYVATEDYGLLRIDPQLTGVTATSKNAIPSGSYYLPFIGADGALWATPDEGGIVELDPATLKPVRSYQLQPLRNPGWNFGGAVTGHRLFVGSARSGGVLSIPTG